MEEGISVIICCYNSSSRIKPTLEHLYAQKEIPTNMWEVIVVDNASSDDTAKKALEIWSKFSAPKPNFDVVSELTPGLSSARHRGIQESRFKYVLFCDDDNWLDDTYLINVLNLMRSVPGIGALGGIGAPVFELEEPPYFWRNQYHVLAVGDQWKFEGDITEERGVLYGAGMVINKSAYNTLLHQYNFKFQVSDRVGNNLISSGDQELCLALKKIGFKIFYSKSLRFRHYIPRNRTTIGYYKKLFLSFGKSYAMLLVYFIDRNTISSLKNDYRYICLRCVKNVIATWIQLLLAGFYTGANKYKYINEMHYLYNNIGIIKRMFLIKNSYKRIIEENLIFNLNTKE
jgi:glycosyltransferase involved in cell wall biosynthesis